MDSNVIKRFGKYIVYTGYILLIFLIVIDIHFLSELHNISVSNLAEFARDKNSLILSIGGTLILVIVLMLYQQLTVNNPLKTFSNKLKELAENDFNSLSTALTEMAQGNLTKSIQLQSMPINYSGNGKVGELVKGLNSIISNMSEAGKEFNNATDTPCKRLFYVGADSYLEGRKCGEAMGKTLNGKGKVIVVLERFGIIGHELRRKGFQTFLEENFPAINIIDVIEGQADINFCYEETKRIINKYHDVDGIYVTFGGTSVAKAVRNLNKNGKIKIICHDVNNSLMEYIVKGEVTATLSQDEFAQGHDPVIHLYNHIVSGWKPTEPRLLTRMDFISKENYSNYWQMGKGLIESDEIKERRAKPIKESSRKIKIAVLGRQGQEFWETLRAGVVSASNKLRKYNAEVDWIIPKGSHTEKGFDVSAKIYGAAINECIENKYDAICLGIYDKNLVAYINKAIDSGVAVATYNSEPMSLRGLFKTFFERTHKLSDLSHNLNDSARQTVKTAEDNANSIAYMVKSLEDEAMNLNTANSNMTQIASAINNIAHDSHDQKESVQSVSSSAVNISKAVNQANQNAESVSKASKQAVDIAKQGAESVKKNLEQMTIIEQTVIQFAKKIEGMAEQSGKIEEIIQTIEGIAEQTNLLALNAAIEAARAGDHGRGFAVVADEVRSLAERSATATKQTSSLINKVQTDIKEASESIKMIVSRVNEGSETAGGAGKAIDQLLDSSQTMKSKIDSVASANQEISTFMTELLESIEVISKVIDQNMSATEELSSGVKSTVEMINNITGISGTNSSTIYEISSKTDKAKIQSEELDIIATELSSMADELQGATAQFKIDN